MNIQSSKIINWVVTQYNAIFKPEERKIEGLFYKIKDQEMHTRGYLLGTMHYQLYPPIVLDAKIEKSFEKASKLFLETEFKMDSPEKIKKFIELGCIDLLLDQKALAIEKKRGTIEQSNDRQAAMNFVMENNLPALIIKVIEQAKIDPDLLTDEEKEFFEIFKHLKTSWVMGDGSYFETVRKATPRELCADRDLFIVDNIDLILGNEKPFIAIGSAHLVGEDGVVSLLRKKGWTVLKVNRTKAPRPILVKKIGKIVKAFRQHLDSAFSRVPSFDFFLCFRK